MRKINIYDFDKTIYFKDASLEFWKYCIFRKKSLILILPYQIFYYVLNKLKIVSIEKFKEKFFIYLKFINYENILEEFWNKEINNLNIKILKKIQESKIENICISASPEFLLEIPCSKIKIDKLIGTKYNLKKYIIEGKNCKGKEKIRQLERYIKKYEIENFYSDSLSDKPLFDIAKNGYLIKKKRITKYIKK